jgi:arsenate reductase
MAELGIDITGDTSTTIQEIDMAEFDFVITICAEETCQCAVESSGNLHWCIDGPPSDNASLNPVEMRKRFGRIRDVIHARLASFQADHLK